MRLLKSHPILDLLFDTRFWYEMLISITTLIIYFVLAVAVTVVIKNILNLDTVHCAEQVSDAYTAAKDSKGKLVTELLSNSSRKIPDNIQSAINTINLDQNQEAAVNTVTNPVRAAVARTAGQGVEYAIINFNFKQLLTCGIPAGSVAAMDWKHTPVNLYVKSLAAGLAASVTVSGVSVGKAINNWLDQGNLAANTTRYSNSTSSTASNANSINPNYPIHSSLEKEDSIFSFLVSIYEYLLGWMNHHDPNRLSSNIDGTMFDLSNYNFFFTSFNLIVYLMFTAVLYYIFIGFVQLSLKYFKNIVSRISNSNGVVYTTSVMGKMIVVIEVMLIMVFVFGMACSVVLYIYYHLPIEVAKHLNSTMTTKVNKSTDYTIGYSIGGVSFYYSQKFLTFVIACILGFYRTFVLIKPLECHKYTKIAIVFLSVNFVSFVTQFITNMVALNSIGLTFIELFNKCNNGIDLVFYSFVTVILSSVIQYFFLPVTLRVTAKEKKGKKSALFTENKRHTVYDIISIFLKLVTSMALFGVFQGSLSLFVLYIPGNTYDI